MSLREKLRKKESGDLEEFDDSPERALAGGDFASANTQHPGAGSGAPTTASSTEPTKREERRARRQQKNLEKQRSKQQKAAQLEEEASQMQGEDQKTKNRRRRRFSGLMPTRLRKNNPHDQAAPTDSEIVAGMMGTKAGMTNDDVSTSDGLQELLQRESGMAPTTAPHRSSRRGDRYQGPIHENGDQASRMDDMPVKFDTAGSARLEKGITAFIIVGMASFVIVVLVIVFQIISAGSGQSSTISSQGLSAGAAGATGAAIAPTQPAGRAAELGEGFANSYLAYPGSNEEDTAEYVSSLESYLHPEADPDLFIPIAAEDTPPTEVKYASATSVTESPGVDRYKVLVDARLQETPLEGSDEGSSESSSGDTTKNETLAVYVKVPKSGSGAYVVAPPTVTESASGPDNGMPGIYGFQDAQALGEGPLKNTLQNFFDALYAERDSRPLVKEEMVEGAAVGGFPPEERSYAGIERAAIYYRDNLEAAEEKGFKRLYDVEVYAEVLDQSTGRTTLDAWSLTVGESQEGGYKIVSVN
jgi:hypothetical protein